MKLYRLAAEGPSAHNIDRGAVIVQEEIRRDVARTYSVTLPPASVLVLVNEVTQG